MSSEDLAVDAVVAAEQTEDAEIVPDAVGQTVSERKMQLAERNH